MATTKSSLAGVGLVGSTTFRLDNVAVTAPAAAATVATAEAVPTAPAVSAAPQLASLLQSSSLIGPAVLKGNKLSVKAACPKKVSVTCTLTLRGC